MDISSHHRLPEGMEVDEVARYFDILMKEAANEPHELTLKKLEVLGDYQWHSCERPSAKVRAKLECWIESNWTSSQEFLNTVLRTCYYFGLRKSLYEKALSLYQGDFRDEYEECLLLSRDEFINPYSKA